jgi:hypothetical protein
LKKKVSTQNLMAQTRVERAPAQLYPSGICGWSVGAHLALLGRIPTSNIPHWATCLTTLAVQGSVSSPDITQHVPRKCVSRKSTTKRGRGRRGKIKTTRTEQHFHRPSPSPNREQPCFPFTSSFGPQPWKGGMFRWT